jgi:hypothetical protein
VKRRRIFAMLAAAAGAALMMAAMTTSPARADTAPTSTTLTLFTNSVFNGLEDENTLSVDVSGGNGSPAGSFGVFIGQTIVCSGAVSNGSGACSLAPNALAPGTYPLTAIYSGDENSGSSASNTVNLTVVAQQPTTTTLTLSAPTVTFGREQAEQLNVRVVPVLAGIATGTVTITAGSATVCTITLDQGDDSCTLTASQLPVGSYQLTATYGGGQLTGQGRNGTFAGSASTAQALTVVALQPTTTTLTLSAPSVPFGNEQTENLTATSGPPRAAPRPGPSRWRRERRPYAPSPWPGARASAPSPGASWRSAATRSPPPTTATAPTPPPRTRPRSSPWPRSRPLLT